ncbi:MAG TPA: cysteine synthase A [Candidatus Polarisedimenticolia bacterium]|nr:cysteine synthase A [Candidatus Polarisedimenticolia bacterium]
MPPGDRPITSLELIGDTPLVHLRCFDQSSGCRILGKCEFLAPGGSVKDRAALFMVEDAERSGRLKASGVVVEGTAGNTGISVAMVAAAKGYRCLLVIPETMAREKVELARALGAEVVLARKAPWGDPEHYHQVAQRLVAQTPGAVFMDQFNNPANTRAHYETTGPEIWRQTGGRVDALVTGMGTSGTLIGAGRYLKERNPAVRILAADPMGSLYYNVVTSGEARAEGSSILEGVGIGRLPGIFDQEPLDGILRVTDAEALEAMWRIIRQEGLFVGGSSGLSVAGALKAAQGMKPGSTLVTVLCDTGRNSMSKVFNEEWRKAQGLAGA